MPRFADLTRRSFVAAAVPLLGADGASGKFTRQYFHDKDKQNSGFADFAMPSDKRGYLMGALVEVSGKPVGLMLSTADGKNWGETRLKFIPRTFFALDDSQLWAVEIDGDIWYSAEGGRDWRRISSLKGALRVHFLDASNGFAVGVPKGLWRTSDGGKSWKAVKAAEGIKANADSTAFTWLDFIGGKGIVAGVSRRLQRRSSPLPDWMEPELAEAKPVVPSLSHTLDTLDGGENWVSSSVSTFGQIHRLRLSSDGVGFTLIQFTTGSFPYGGELYKFTLGGKGKTERILRPEKVYLEDFAYIPGEGIYVACTEKPGNLRLPVPTKVSVLFSKDLVKWENIPVDYRTVGKRLFLSVSAGKQVWLATDEGMILSLTK